MSQHSPVARLQFDQEENILHICMLENVHMDLQNTIEHYRRISEITQGQNYFALIDANHFFSIDEDAMLYASQPEITQNRKAAAHYTMNMANRITANFFRAHGGIEFPFRTFKSEAEAREWLKEQRFASLQ